MLDQSTGTVNQGSTRTTLKAYGQKMQMGLDPIVCYAFSSKFLTENFMRQRVCHTLLFLAVALPAFSQSSDLGVSKTGPDSATAGSNVTYTITVYNVGPD